VPTTFVTALGGDSTSEDLRNHINSYGIDLCEIRDEKLNAPTYLGVLDDNNDAIIGISDMEVNNGLTFERIYERFFKEEEKNGINPDDIVVVDANVVDDDGSLLRLLQYLNEKGYFVIYECKGRKAIRVATDSAYKYMSLLKMNDKERDLVIRTLKETGVTVD
jgi:sugar/nucleoside kinase (ribokinase family)